MRRESPKNRVFTGAKKRFSIDERRSPTKADVRGWGIGGGEYRTKSERGTLRLAKRFGRSLKGDEVVFLIGTLGAGKTVFAKGVAAGLGLRNVRDVCSPTFTLLNVYQARVPIYHLDLYRLGGRAEIRDLGFEDYVGDGVILVEWGEKIDFPLPAIRVTIEVEPDGRRRIFIRAGKKNILPS